MILHFKTHLCTNVFSFYGSSVLIISNSSFISLAVSAILHFCLVLYTYETHLSFTWKCRQSQACCPPCYQSEMHTHTLYGTEHRPTERWSSLALTWQSHRFEFQIKFGSCPVSLKDKLNVLNLPSSLTCKKKSCHYLQCCLPKIKASVRFYVT